MTSQPRTAADMRIRAMDAGWHKREPGTVERDAYDYWREEEIDAEAEAAAPLRAAHLRTDKCWTHHAPDCTECPRYWLHSDAALSVPEREAGERIGSDIMRSPIIHPEDYGYTPEAQPEREADPLAWLTSGVGKAQPEREKPDAADDAGRV